MADRPPEMDPQARAVIDSYTLPEWHTLSVESARRLEDEVFSGPPEPAVADVREFAIPGPDGNPLPVRVYRPTTDGSRPTLVYYHGGGWVLGTLDSIDGACRDLCVRADVVVVSVDYRLAPDHPFPAAPDDAAAALAWVAANGERIGGDGRVAVAGTSAGGALAAVTAIRAAAMDGPDLAHQLLLYPITDPGCDTASHREDACPWLTRADMVWFWDKYLRSPVDRVNPYAAPLRASDDLLVGVAPATVVTAGFDPLRDEGAAYAERLDEAGVPTTHRHAPAQPHGFLSLTGRVDEAEAVMQAVASDLRAAFG